MHASRAARLRLRMGAVKAARQTANEGAAEDPVAERRRAARAP